MRVNFKDQNGNILKGYNSYENKDINLAYVTLFNVVVEDEEYDDEVNTIEIVDNEVLYSITKTTNGWDFTTGSLEEIERKLYDKKNELLNKKDLTISEMHVLQVIRNISDKLFILGGE